MVWTPTGSAAIGYVGVIPIIIFWLTSYGFVSSDVITNVVSWFVMYVPNNLPGFADNVFNISLNGEDGSESNVVSYVTSINI